MEIMESLVTNIYIQINVNQWILLKDIEFWLNEQLIKSIKKIDWGLFK